MAKIIQFEKATEAENQNHQPDTSSILDDVVRYAKNRADKLVEEANRQFQKSSNKTAPKGGNENGET